MTQTRVWRFGYGSNMSPENLRRKKQLDVLGHLAGVVRDWKLSFDLPGPPFVDPAFACVQKAIGDDVHGVAFQISTEDAARLDRQEGSYTVEPVTFTSYDGQVIHDVGLYVPRPDRVVSGHDGRPSRRYLRILLRGAEEVGLDPGYIARLEACECYATDPEIRAETLRRIDDAERDPERRDTVWNAGELAAWDGSDPARPAHTSVLGYVVRVRAFFPSWRGHTITRRNLLHFNGESVDAGDIRVGQAGFSPLPDVARCTAEEREFLWQNLDHLLQIGGVIVGRLQDFMDAQRG